MTEPAPSPRSSAGPAEDADVIIVGGGPAGMVAGLLFARAGVRTLVLEKHTDFLRDFRGDTVHPSTLRLFAEMGLLDALLARPHDKVRTLGVWVGDRHFTIADFSSFDRRWNFIAFMPQWHFLDFLADEARRYPCFTLKMGTEAHDLLTEDGRIAGVRYTESGRERTARAALVLAADGRRSDMRASANLPLRTLGATMDVFWFRVPKARAEENQSTGIVAPGRLMPLIDRGDYWQCAYVFPKGQAEAVRARGIDWFREDVAHTARIAQLDTTAIASWDDVKLLSVALDRLEQWHRPGFLAIGDAAHAMSPIGGIGINVAVQDAVAAANILAGPMAESGRVDALLPKVQARRLPAVRLTQRFQDLAQKRIVAPVMGAGERELQPAAVLRLLDRVPWLRRIPATLVGFGIRPEHVRSPVAGR